MKKYQFSDFGLQNLELTEAPVPEPGDGEIRLDVKALSLNFRDLVVVAGSYNPRLKLPATPVSDGAGVVSAVGPGVTRVRAGDAVMSHFISGWIDGPYQGEYLKTTLGTPGPGLAAEQVVLPAEAVLPVPKGYDFAEAATLPIAALTAWTALVSEGHLKPGQWVLTLGTGGVSIFALQLAKAMGARVVITSSRDDKLEKARGLGADACINYKKDADWEKRVLEATGGAGADVTVETAGAGTFTRSLRATRPGGTVGLLGSLAGLKGEVNLAYISMRRIRVAGIIVNSRAAFEEMVRFLDEHPLRPVIDRRLPFEKLPDAFRNLEAGEHFGKIVVEV